MGIRERIELSIKSFNNTVEKYSLYNDVLKEFLGEELYTAPASTMKDHNNAFPGGLVDHILRVAKYAVKINELLPDNLKNQVSSVLKVCFIHQLGKVFLYKPNESEWHRNNLGKMYEYNDDLRAMKIGERSAFYALKCGLLLTDEEYHAIISHDKPETDPQVLWHSTSLSLILRQAILLAMLEEKNTVYD